MATVNYSETVTWDGQAKVFRWALANSEDGQPLEFSAFADRSVQVVGTFGSGGTVRIEGSNDSINYAVLTDPQGNALDITAAKIEAILEATRWIRPRVTAGDGTTALVISMFVRRSL